MFILDTNVISELRHGKPRQSPQVRMWAAAQPASRLFISAITILELEKGILALERRTPPEGSALRVWLSGVRMLLLDACCPSPTTPPPCAQPCIYPTRARNVMR